MAEQLWALRVDTEPTEEPITTAEAKAHLRVTASDEDTLIDSMIKAARLAIEQHTRRAIITQTLLFYLPDWPSDAYIELPRPELQSVTSVKYTDKDATQTTITATDYVVTTAGDPGRLSLKWDKSWPITSLQVGLPIVVEYVAGYGAATAVPEAIKQAMKILVAQQYEHREPVLVGSIVRDMPKSADWLLESYRVRTSSFGGRP